MSKDHGVSRKILYILPLVFIIFVSLHLQTSIKASTSIKVTVMDEKSRPIEGAELFLWDGRTIVKSYETDSYGNFEFVLQENESYTLYVLADDESTPGMDFLPFRINGFPSQEENLILSTAASLILEGDILFVESEQLPASTEFVVKDVLLNATMIRQGVPLIFGESDESQSYFLGKDLNLLIIPVEDPFGVEIKSSIIAGSNIVTKSFELDGIPTEISKGEEILYDVQRSSTLYNIHTVESTLSEVEHHLDEMAGIGFYLNAERHKLYGGSRSSMVV